MARDANEIWSSKGTKLVHLDLRKNEVGDDEILKIILGPTGNLRAPTLRMGKVLLVGFDESVYSKVLVGSDEAVYSKVLSPGPIVSAR